jgi:hypothetical protein
MCSRFFEAHVCFPSFSSVPARGAVTLCPCFTFLLVAKLVLRCHVTSFCTFEFSNDVGVTADEVTNNGA